MRFLILIQAFLMAGPSLAQDGSWVQTEVGSDLEKISVLAVGDLDGDGDAEFIAAQAGAHANNVKVFQWCDDTGGSFTCHDVNQAWWEAQDWDFAGAMRTADLDEDGDVDIVFTGDHHTGVGEGFVYWAENPRITTVAEGTDPHGDWTIHPIYSFDRDTDHINDMALADYDNDGKLDIAIRHLDEDGGTETRRVRILYQDDLSAGTWTLKSIAVAPREGMQAGDLDGDGYPDLWLNGFILGNPGGSRTASWTRYNVAPWAYSQTDTGLNNATKNAIADFNGDGHLDLVISRAEGSADTGSSTEGKLAIYLSDGTPFNGGWTEVVLETDWTNAHQAEVGDVDGDGNLDVVTGLSFGSTGIWVWHLAGSGTLREKDGIENSEGSYTGRLADTDGDGDLDYIGPSTYNGQVYHYENQLDTARMSREGRQSQPVQRYDRGDALLDTDEFEVYPNPAASTVTVQHPAHGTVAVFDVLGRLVTRFDTVGRATTLSSLPPGQYVVQYTAGEGLIDSRILIIIG